MAKKKAQFKLTSKSHMYFNMTCTVKLTNDVDVNIQVHVKDRPGAYAYAEELALVIADALNKQSH